MNMPLLLMLSMEVDTSKKTCSVFSFICKQEFIRDMWEDHQCCEATFVPWFNVATPVCVPECVHCIQGQFPVMMSDLGLCACVSVSLSINHFKALGRTAVRSLGTASGPSWGPGFRLPNLVLSHMVRNSQFFHRDMCITGVSDKRKLCTLHYG